MTNILSTLRGSGIFCVKLVRNTSKLLSSIFSFYGNDQQDLNNADDVVTNSETEEIPFDNNVPENVDFRWPSSSAFVPEAPSRSDSQCSCMSCALPIRLPDRQRRPSRLVEGVSAEKYYKFGELLGEGTFSQVYLAEALASPGGLVAVKVVDKSSLIRKKTPTSAEEDSELPAEIVQEYEDLRWLIDREIQVRMTIYSTDMIF